MSDPVSDLDGRFLAAAIRLGASALGTTWPNPAVGAILVKDGVVLGRGRTARGGRPHAETQALAEAGEAARGATLYVSLEPCAHHGRTPPCADAVVAAGVARVVAPLADADRRVSGTGFARMEAAGVRVVRSLLAQPGERAQAGHLKRVRLGRPYVTLKLAVSADEAIGRPGEAQVAVTGPVARRHVHALRSRFDAILVGGGTVLADDPLLTCRLPGLEHRSPVRVVLDTERRLSRTMRVFTDPTAPTWLFVAAPAGPYTKPAPSPLVGEGWGGGTPEPNRQGEETPPLAPPHKGEGDGRGLGRANHLELLAVPRTHAGLDLHAVLQRLAAEGITRVLVEGGAKLARSLLEADLLDEIILFRSPVMLGPGAIPALAGLPLAALTRSDRFRRIESRSFGPDRMSRFERTA